MSALLERLDRAQVQWNRTRRNRATPSGVVVVHTAESVADLVGLDSGAENVGAWIARRDPDREGYGSYHHLSDRDSAVQLVPWASEAFHCRFTNNHSVGISAAVRTVDWQRMSPSQREAIVANMAKGARDFAAAQAAAGRPVPPARRITRAQALARVPGFISHGDTDPGRRSDPGAHFPWDLFLELYEGDEDMPSPREIADAVKAVIPNPWAYMFGRGDSRVSAGQMLAEARRDAAGALAVVKEIAARPADGAQIDPDELEQIIARAAERIEIDVTVTAPPD